MQADRAELILSKGGWRANQWRRMVLRAIAGRRGQLFLRDLLAALDRVYSRRLISGRFFDDWGEVCALGALARDRHISLNKVKLTDHKTVAKRFKIADALAREVMFLNDRARPDITPEQRYQMVRNWVKERIKQPEPEVQPAAAQAPIHPPVRSPAISATLLRPSFTLRPTSGPDVGEMPPPPGRIVVLRGRG